MREAAVRRLTMVLLAAAVLATAATAAGVDARLLVLQKGDVPAGFHLQGLSNRYLSNAAVARSNVQLRRLVTRSGRISGYTATYENGAPTIVSVAHLFQKDGGAHVFYAAEDAKQRALNAERVKRGGRAYRHETVVLGDEAFLYRSTQTPKVTLVVWRSGRAIGAVSTWRLGRDRTIALARAQQRRIGKTLG